MSDDARTSAVRDLVIIGAGGHGREALDVVEAMNARRVTWRLRGFLDDGHPPADRLARRGTPLLGPVSKLEDLEVAYIAAVGASEVRERIDAVATGYAREAVPLVHPASSVGGDVLLAPGVIIAAGARVTTNVRLGRHTHVNVGAVISHDCRVADFVTLSPGVLVNGEVTLGRHVMLGTGAIVTPGCTIGAGTWVGAGAVVMDDLPAGVVATGVPARVRRTR